MASPADRIEPLTHDLADYRRHLNDAKQAVQTVARDGDPVALAVAVDEVAGWARAFERCSQKLRRAEATAERRRIEGQ
jgi:hypothetical protein